MFDKIFTELTEKISTSKAQKIVPPEGGVGDSAILVEASSLLEVMNFLKNHPIYKFKVLQVISGVDYLEYIELNYFLSTFDLEGSYDLNIKVRLTGRVNLKLPSLTSIYPSSNFLERECFDMFGVEFENHPDLRRILCPDDWKGFPLRKDYIPAKYYQDMELFPEAKMNMQEREFIVTSKDHQEELIKKSLAKGL